MFGGWLAGGVLVGACAAALCAALQAPAPAYWSMLMGWEFLPLADLALAPLAMKSNRHR
jgi:hypothetical protein